MHTCILAHLLSIVAISLILFFIEQYVRTQHNVTITSSSVSTHTNAIRAKVTGINSQDVRSTVDSVVLGAKVSSLQLLRSLSMLQSHSVLV